jgi:hypothetical protein
VLKGRCLCGIEATGGSLGREADGRVIWPGPTALTLPCAPCLGRLPRPRSQGGARQVRRYPDRGRCLGRKLPELVQTWSTISPSLLLYGMARWMSSRPTLALVWMRFWEALAEPNKVWQSLRSRLGEGSFWWDNTRKRRARHESPRPDVNVVPVPPPFRKSTAKVPPFSMLGVPAIAANSRIQEKAKTTPVLG